MTDTKTLIEELKDPKLAQPLGIYEKYYPEKMEILKKAGVENCLTLDCNSWQIDRLGRFSTDYTYILKPDYKPEPEYVDLEIDRDMEIDTGNEWYGVHKSDDSPFLPYLFTHLHCLPSLPGFAGFWSDETPKLEDDLAFQYVGREIDKGKKVYARFRRESE